MKDSFFVQPPISSKRKRVQPPKKSPRGDVADQDEDATFQFDDLDDMDLRHNRGDVQEDEEDQTISDQETAQEKRIRLAKEYISQIGRNESRDVGDGTAVPGDFDAAELDREIIESRLRQDLNSAQYGRVKRQLLADSIMANLASPAVASSHPVRNLRGHSGPVYAVVICPREKYVYSGSKDGQIIQWCIETGRKIHSVGKSRSKPADSKETAEFHTGPITALAISTDGRFLASGSSDRRVNVYTMGDNGMMKLTKTFRLHRDAVTGLAFRQAPRGLLNTDLSVDTLFSASNDRTIKVYNMATMSYVETLYGHQEAITSLSGFGTRERCLSTGGRDRSIRLWKIVEETQLVFRASSTGKVHETEKAAVSSSLITEALGRDETGSVDKVAYINDDLWISGSDGGTLSLWTPLRKKPVFTLPNAHGRLFTFPSDGEDDQNVMTSYTHDISINRHVNIDRRLVGVPDGEPIHSTPNWISALTAVPHGDIIASGSSDGNIRLWKLNDPSSAARDLNLEQIAILPTKSAGWINSLAISHSGKWIVAGLGREPLTGRHCISKSGKNIIKIYKVLQ